MEVAPSEETQDVTIDEARIVGQAFPEVPEIGRQIEGTEREAQYGRGSPMVEDPRNAMEDEV